MDGIIHLQISQDLILKEDISKSVLQNLFLPLLENWVRLEAMLTHLFVEATFCSGKGFKGLLLNWQKADIGRWKWSHRSKDPLGKELYFIDLVDIFGEGQISSILLFQISIFV